MNKTKLYEAMRLIRHSGDVFAPGTDENQLTLSDKQAAPLLALVPPAITLLEDLDNDDSGNTRPEDEGLAKAEIVAAINALDENNAELFTQNGKPTTQAIEAILGYQVSAAERDALWLEMSDESEYN
jgi:hypothetical protein